MPLRQLKVRVLELLVVVVLGSGRGRRKVEPSEGAQASRSLGVAAAAGRRAASDAEAKRTARTMVTGPTRVVQGSTWLSYVLFCWRFSSFPTVLE